MERFEIADYIKMRSAVTQAAKEKQSIDYSFEALCLSIKEAFLLDWDSKESSKAALDIQKKAIIGYANEKEFFKKRIAELIDELCAQSTEYPTWYDSLVDGVYQENWGLAGVSEWFLPLYFQSSSAKIIGERIYFLEDGKMVLKLQKISKTRKEQLIRAFLLLTPEERMDKVYHETYLLDGTRVTVFTEPMAKAGQDAIVFRRYVVPILSFEEQAKRGTIPKDVIPLFCTMVDIGFNVVFLGAVRTAKTTFLTTWQSYEDPALEGVMVETDPEIPLHIIMPDAPILQLIADGEELSRISKNLLRSDADYFILAEARDGIALDTAIKLASKGTKRMKLTYHSGNPVYFPLNAADEIVKATGGDLKLTMQKVASSFDYLFHFIQLTDKREKRLKSIRGMSCMEDGSVSMQVLCEYDVVKDAWSFYDQIGMEQVRYAMESTPFKLSEMQNILSDLAHNSPIYNKSMNISGKE